MITKLLKLIAACLFIFAMFITTGYLPAKACVLDEVNAEDYYPCLGGWCLKKKLKNF